GVVIAAAEDERFTHVKHAKRPVPFSTWELPFHAIDYCLAEAGITLADVDHVAYSYDPWFELDREGTPQALTLPLSPSSRGA
ncbi:carbamoyltransferase, partial [Burkholderia cenocepacia]|nr:carbamoyltransferase [Burkholderia cenocepacia]